MVSLRKILAANMRAYRNELGLSQSRLADLVDTAPNYIAMIECEKRFPTDTMLEKIAVALNRESFELFAAEPVKKQWREELLAELSVFISNKLGCSPEKTRPSEYLTS